MGGNVEVTITEAWDDQTALSLETGRAARSKSSCLSHQEESRRSKTREIRWEGLKQWAFAKLTYVREVELPRDQPQRQESVAAMRTYSYEITERAEQLNDPDADQARKWAGWIRQHADRTAPINGSLQFLASHAPAITTSNTIRTGGAPMA